jgi:hypothetical protein
VRVRERLEADEPRSRESPRRKQRELPVVRPDVHDRRERVAECHRVVLHGGCDAVSKRGTVLGHAQETCELAHLSQRDPSHGLRHSRRLRVAA